MSANGAESDAESSDLEIVHRFDAKALARRLEFERRLEEERKEKRARLARLSPEERRLEAEIAEKWQHWKIEALLRQEEREEEVRRAATQQPFTPAEKQRKAENARRSRRLDRKRDSLKAELAEFRRRAQLTLNTPASDLGPAKLKARDRKRPIATLFLPRRRCSAARSSKDHMIARRATPRRSSSPALNASTACTAELDADDDGDFLFPRPEPGRHKQYVELPVHPSRQLLRSPSPMAGGSGRMLRDRRALRAPARGVVLLSETSERADFDPLKRCARPKSPATRYDLTTWSPTKIRNQMKSLDQFQNYGLPLAMGPEAHNLPSSIYELIQLQRKHTRATGEKIGRATPQGEVDDGNAVRIDR